MYDVAIVGGGISGCMAAISAARNGARTVLIERYGFSGGTLTACGTGPMMTFHAGNVQVVRGIPDELITRLKMKGLSVGHIFDTTGYTYTVTPFSSEGMKMELDSMLTEAGVDIFYHCTLCDVDFSDRTIHSAEIYSKSGKFKIYSKIFIDASGDCDLSVLAGLPYMKGRKKDGLCQPMTMNFKVIDVDIEKTKKYIMSNNEEFPRLKGDLQKVTRSCRLSIGGFVNTLKTAREKGDISFDREDILFFETDRPGEVIVNTTRIINADPTTPQGLTFAEIEGRKQAAEVFTLLKTHIAGFENSKLEFTGPFIGVRCSRRIKGKYVITTKDIINCRMFKDAIAFGGYPIDVHSPDGCDDSVYDKKVQKYGDIYSIPFSALVSDMADNLITVGRCISADFEAQAAIRVSPIAAAVGQSGGTAAALCSRDQISVHQLDIRELHNLLKIQNVYLGGI